MKKLLLICLIITSTLNANAQTRLTGTTIPQRNGNTGFSSLEWGIQYLISIGPGEGKGSIRVDFSNLTMEATPDATYTYNDGTANGKRSYSPADLGLSSWPGAEDQTSFGGTMNVYYKGSLVKTVSTYLVARPTTLGTFYHSGKDANSPAKAIIGSTQIPYDGFNPSDITIQISNVKTGACPNCNTVHQLARQKVNAENKKEPARSNEVTIGNSSSTVASPARGGSLTVTGTNTSANSGNGSSSAKKPDMVNGIDRNTLPKLAMDKSGKYYVKDEQNNYKEISPAEYQQLKKGQQAIATAAAQQTTYTPAAAAEPTQVSETFGVKTETYFQNVATSFYAASAANTAKANIADLQQLKGNFANEQELDRAYQQQYSQISGQVENYTRASNTNLQAAASNIINSSNASTGTKLATVGVSAGMQIFNNLSAERREREAKEELARQRRVALARFEAKRKQALVNYRTSFLSQFPAGGVPMSSHKVPTGTVYFFAFKLDSSAISRDTVKATVTNVFAINKYSDGTWPFKNSLMADLKKLEGDGDITLMGYYTEKDMAAKMRNSFLNMAEKGRFRITEAKFGNVNKTDGVNNDFWGEGKKAAPATAPKKTNDFWNN